MPLPDGPIIPVMALQEAVNSTFSKRVMVSPFLGETCLHRPDAWMGKGSPWPQELSICFMAASSACKRVNAGASLCRSVHAAMRIEPVASSELPPSAYLRGQSDRLAGMILSIRVQGINVGRHFAICRWQNRATLTAQLIGSRTTLWQKLLTGRLVYCPARIPSAGSEFAPPLSHASQQPS